MNVKPPFTGAVKAYTMERFIINEKGREALDYKYIWKYNEYRQLFEVEHYSAKNKLSDISRYTYDDQQNLVEIVVKTVKGSVKQHLFYEYKDGKLSQIIDEARFFKIVTKYDDHGNPLEEQNFRDADAPPSVTRYINAYDKNNMLVEKHTIFPLSDSDWVDQYKYDSDGRLIEENRSRNKAVSIVKHSYNDEGDLIRSDYFLDEVNNETIIKNIVYDTDGNILEIKEYRDGWFNQDDNNEPGLISISRYSYVR
jgi:YD repeat-containing protein